MKIVLKQLRVFLAIVQEKTITSAAEKLFLSKAAVSLSLAELERNLKHKLFERSNNRLLINDQGQQLLPLADEILKRSEAIEQLFNETSAYKGKLHLGCSDTIGNQVLPYLLKAFSDHSGHQDQTVTIGNTAQVCKQLLKFELDFGIVEGRVSDPDLIATPWLGDHMCIIASRDHPLREIPLLQLCDLDNQNWLLREEGSGSREFFISQLVPKIGRWSTAFELNNTEAIINFAATGQGLSCLSYHSARHALESGRVIKLPLPLLLERQYWLLHHKDKYQSPLMTAFFSFCQSWTFNT